MRRTIAGICFVLVAASPVLAQQHEAQPRDQRAAQMHSGSVKIWAGVLMMAAGAVIIPVTVGRAETHDANVGAGVALIGVGSAMLWWGVQDQRKAVGPQTTFGVMAGRRNGIAIQRRW